MKRTPLFTLALALLGAGTAQAQFFQDPVLQALLAAEKFAELDSLASQRAAARADDAQAVLGLALAAMSDRGGPARREVAIRQAEGCVKQAPQAAECHYALGVVLGAHALSQGVLKAASSVGTVKTALLESLKLAPQWYPARSAVVEFYLLAPGMLGGSSSKAAEAAKGAARPEQVRALEARVALADERFDAAIASLSVVQAGADASLADDVQQWLAAAGFGLLGKGQAAQAKPVFERLQREQPAQAMGAYGLGRVLFEQGELAEAVKRFEQARPLKGAAQLPIDDRLGVTLQAQGQTEPAKAALARFVAAGKGSGKSLDDAKKRLAQLGQPVG